MQCLDAENLKEEKIPPFIINQDDGWIQGFLRNIEDLVRCDRAVTTELM